jgi:hypothetical protein
LPSILKALGSIPTTTKIFFKKEKNTIVSSIGEIRHPFLDLILVQSIFTIKYGSIRLVE